MKQVKQVINAVGSESERKEKRRRKEAMDVSSYPKM
jgi:hypothetical protein